MASQLAAEAVIAEQKSKLNLSGDQSRFTDLPTVDQERLEQLKQEHFKDIINESHSRVRYAGGHSNLGGARNTSGMNTVMGLPPRPQLEKVYGNLNDIVSYEERHIEQQLKANNAGRAYSPSSSQLTMKRPVKHDKQQNKRMTGLEAIYLQKFEKQ